MLTKKYNILFLLLLTTSFSNIFSMQPYKKTEPSKEQKEYKECSICFEEMADPKENTILLCEHTFHAHCILHWLWSEGKKYAPYAVPITL